MTSDSLSPKDSVLAKRSIFREGEKPEQKEGKRKGK
jgi:hypothetical protein